MKPATLKRMYENTIADYIRVERGSELKHEFIRGVIVVMTGGSIDHARMVTSVSVQLSSQLRGRDREAFGSELRVRVPNEDLILYPDGSIMCGEAQLDVDDEDAIVNPTVIVEVTSPSTDAYNRGEKFECYKLIPTLREYVLVSHTERMIEVFRREASGTWVLAVKATSGEVPLESARCVLNVDETYQRVKLTRPTAS